MTFQQLEYIVAVEKYRHFVNAATACGVTQSTLSSMIQKLEQEIDVIIFDRSKHPIEPTPLGKQIITQARLILHNSTQLRELILNEKEQEQGTLYIGMLPCIAPYLYPAFCRTIGVHHPGIRTYIYEESPAEIVAKVQKSEIDMAFVPSGLNAQGTMEIELYTERFMLYVSPSHALHQRPWVTAEDLMDGDLWLLGNYHPNYPQFGPLLRQDTHHRTQFEAGSLSTLVALIDQNGGYTLLPALYERCLTEEQRKNLRPINSGKFFRTISLIIRTDYVRERMLNIVAEMVKQIIPEDMIMQRIKKYKITL